MNTLQKFQPHKRKALPLQKLTEESQETPVSDMSGKGEKNGRCNRTACGSRSNVVWYNRITRAYYCRSCAWEINKYWTGNDPLCSNSEAVEL